MSLKRSPMERNKAQVGDSTAGAICVPVRTIVYFPAEMLEIYPQQIVRTGIQDVWQRSPVSLETCYTVPGWKERGYDVDYIIAQGLRWHVSTANIKSSPIPADWKEKFDDFQSKIGYRFILRRLEYSKTVEAGSMMPVHMWWLNAGVAPIYAEYNLAMQLRSSHSSTQIRIPVDVRKWLPGDAVFDGSVYIPEHLAAGNYRRADRDARSRELTSQRSSLPMKAGRMMAGMRWARSQ